VEKLHMDIKQIEHVINALQFAKKPSAIVLKVGIIFLACLSLLLALNMHTDSVLYSTIRFIGAFFATSLFIVGLYTMLNNTKIAIDVTFASIAIDRIANNDWTFNLNNIKRLHPLILLHPAFRAIMGLYIFQFGRVEDGITIIEKAAKELPIINMAITNGQIKNIKDLKHLESIIRNDIRPNKFVLLANEILQTAVSVLTVFIIGAFLIAFLCDLLM
jgi:hypothetical protein